MNEILNDFFMGKQDLKTTEDIIIQTLEDMAIHLKSCPFCGGDAKLIKKHECIDMQFDDDHDYAHVECSKCGSRGTRFEARNARYHSDTCKAELEEIKHKAIEAWNRRITT